MKFKNAIIIILFISAGFCPADIFLYAQKSIKTQLINAEELLDKKEIDSSFIILNNILKDTIHINKSTKAELYFLLTKYFASKNKEEIEIYYNKKAELLFRELKNEERLSEILYAKFDLLINQRNLSAKIEAKSYLDEFYKLAIKKNKKQNLIKAHKGFARLKLNPIEYKEALVDYDKAIEVAKIINDTLAIANILNNKGLVISHFYKKQDSARQFFKQAIVLYDLVKNRDKKFSSYLNIGLSYQKENKLYKALKWLKKADAILLKEYKNNNKRLLYGYMSNTYEGLKDYKNALDYVWLYNDYKDSVDIKAQNIAISEIQVKYKTLAKEKENIELKAANKRKQFYIIGSLAALFGFLIFGYLGYRNLKRKKQIAEKNIAIEHQKVVALVKDQELLSIDAMIEGQEKERKRIAEDLHDNLGSTLATLKLHFDNYRDHFSSGNEKQIKMLDNTENILNEAYNKVRTMAHANQASVLAEHSLIEAVKSLAYKISSANKTAIEVVDFGFHKPLNHTIEITLFRIIQELITNIVKHANATKATIDLTLFEDSLGLIVEDNGVGFSISKLDVMSSGMGLNSIKKRIEYLNGTFSIDTKLEVGTSILIEIPIIEEI